MSVSEKSSLDGWEKGYSSPPAPRRSCNMLRSKRRLLLWIVGIFASIVLISRTAYTIAHRRADNRALAVLEKTFTTFEHPKSDLSLDGNRRILIVQHVRGKRIDRASELTHKLYADAWGYRHKTTSGNYCGKNVHGSFNKQFVLRDAMREELKHKTSDWILYTDADTIVSDPSIALHLLLPPEDRTPEPLLLGSQDHNGFNAGVFLIRVHPTMLEFLEDLISDTLLPGKLSDQHYMGLRLRTQQKYSDHFYEIPKQWLNAYWLNELGTKPWKPMLHVHLVNWLSDSVSWRPMVRQAIRIAKEAKGAYSREYNVRGSVQNSIFGFELLPQYENTKKSSEKWWKQAVNGIRKMRFLDENGEGTKISGDQYSDDRRYMIW